MDARRANPAALIITTALLLALTGCGGDSTGVRPSFQGLGVLNDEPHAATRGFGISLDGSTIVGDGFSDNSLEGFRWRAASGLQGLGFPQDKMETEALAANQDGSVIVGLAAGFMGLEMAAARWSQSGGWEILQGNDDAVPIEARGTSADGNTIVGAAQLNAVPMEAFLWTAGSGIQLLGLLSEGKPTQATGVFADGTVVSGFGTKDTGACVAFRWTAGTGLVVLPAREADEDCFGLNISADGSTIVGDCVVGAAPEAVLWDETGVVGLGFLPNGGVGSFLRAVSGDGSVGVGEGGDSQGMPRAVLWTRANGMRDLRGVLIDLGLGSEVEGWFLSAAYAISSDGHTITGFGADPDGVSQAFVATLP
jgi:uncharacterized membrane protein